MAGKYFRVYLREELHAAFKEMQKNTDSTANGYISKSVEAKLEADGYLGETEVQDMTMVVGPQAGKTITRRVRRRRSQ